MSREQPQAGEVLRACEVDQVAGVRRHGHHLDARVARRPRSRARRRRRRGAAPGEVLMAASRSPPIASPISMKRSIVGSASALLPPSMTSTGAIASASSSPLSRKPNAGPGLFGVVERHDEVRFCWRRPRSRPRRTPSRPTRSRSTSSPSSCGLSRGHPAAEHADRRDPERDQRAGGVLVGDDSLGRPRRA